MKSMKYMLAVAAMMGTVAMFSGGAIANETTVHTKTVKAAGATPGDVKTSNDDSGMNHDDAPHDKVGTIPGEATPGDVKTSNDDSGMNNDAAPNDKVGTIPGEATPGDVKTSNDDSGMNHDDATHDKVLENGKPAK